MPAYAVFLNDIHKAVPLSKVTIFGACLVSVLFNIRRRHPKTKGPLICYELAALLEPFTLLGGILGVLLNIVMTDAQILACLVMTLSFTCYKTFKKGLAQRAEETRILRKGSLPSPPAALEAAADSLRGARLCMQFLPSRTARPWLPGGHVVCLRTFSCVSGSGERESLLQPAELEVEGGGGSDSPLQDTTFFAESERVLDIQDGLAFEPSKGKRASSPCAGTCVVSVVFLVVDSVLNVVLLTLAGGPVALFCGGPLQQAALLFLISFHVLGTFLYARWLLRSQRKRAAKGQTPAAGLSVEDSLTSATAFVYPLLSLLAGVLAGSIGIGGGLIKGPLLLEIGLSPMAAISTANFMIFFTSSANTLQYAILGRLELAESLCFLCTAGLAGAVGLLCVYQFMKRTHRQSYLTFFLAFVTLLSLSSMVASFAHTHYWRPQGTAVKALGLEEVCQSQGRLLFTHVG